MGRRGRGGDERRDCERLHPQQRRKGEHDRPGPEGAGYRVRRVVGRGAGYRVRRVVGRGARGGGLEGTRGGEGAGCRVQGGASGEALEGVLGGEGV